MEEYEEAKEKLGPAFYGDPNTILHGLHKDKKDAIDKNGDQSREADRKTGEIQQA